ncbi:MAG: DUF378 domain-containing protein [Christensenellaceae bacterium]|jgi:uncharacterized membrane protein YuzA (DUF378 family)|nr:DUF378 domain-containing protein [Christensenellaceae bacterium]
MENLTTTKKDTVITAEEKKGFIRTLNLIAFTALLIGGLNYLLMGLFKFNFFGVIFGNGIISQIFYILFGLGGAVLLAHIIIKTTNKNA